VYFVVKNAADGTFIAASYHHDSAIGGFAAALGVAVRLEQVCQSAQPDGCYPGGIDVTNQLRFGDHPARFAEGANGLITIGGQTVRVAAGRLLTLLGGGTSVCNDSGAFWRGGQTFDLAR
jgi:hypothetical protein